MPPAKSTSTPASGMSRANPFATNTASAFMTRPSGPINSRCSSSKSAASSIFIRSFGSSRSSRADTTTDTCSCTANRSPRTKRGIARHLDEDHRTQPATRCRSPRSVATDERNAKGVGNLQPDRKRFFHCRTWTAPVPISTSWWWTSKPTAARRSQRFSSTAFRTSAGISIFTRCGSRSTSSAPAMSRPSSPLIPEPSISIRAAAITAKFNDLQVNGLAPRPGIR